MCGAGDANFINHCTGARSCIFFFFFNITKLIPRPKREAAALAPTAAWLVRSRRDIGVCTSLPLSTSSEIEISLLLLRRSNEDNGNHRRLPRKSIQTTAKISFVSSQPCKQHAEYERVRSLEQRGLFDFEVVCPTPLPTAAVVVVDPFSSGSLLAARVLHYKLRLVMVFSEVTEE